MDDRLYADSSRRDRCDPVRARLRGLRRFLLILHVRDRKANDVAIQTRGNWSVSDFVADYLDIPLVLCAFGLWKLIKKTKIIDLRSIPLAEALIEVQRNPEPPEPSTQGWRRFVSWIWD